MVVWFGATVRGSSNAGLLLDDEIIYIYIIYKAPFSLRSSCLLHEQSRLVAALRRSAVPTRLCVKA